MHSVLREYLRSRFPRDVASLSAFILNRPLIYLLSIYPAPRNKLRAKVRGSAGLDGTDLTRAPAFHGRHARVERGRILNVFRIRSAEQNVDRPAQLFLLRRCSLLHANRSSAVAWAADASFPLLCAEGRSWRAALAGEGVTSSWIKSPRRLV